MIRAETILHDQWLQANIKAPAPVRHSLMPRLHNAKEVLRLAASSMMPVNRLEGQSVGGPMTAAFINVRFSNSLEEYLFTHPVVTVDSRDAAQATIFVNDIKSVDQETIKRFDKQHATPGMRKLVVKSIKWFEGNSVKDIEIPVNKYSAYKD